MTKNEGIRLVNELETERVLVARGYSKTTCKACNGDAFLCISFDPDDWTKTACPACEGAGWVWFEPTKT